jgi:hypothetical protein
MHQAVNIDLVKYRNEATPFTISPAPHPLGRQKVDKIIYCDAIADGQAVHPTCAAAAAAAT